MYQEHFHLHAEPFSIAPDPSFLYLSESHREALAHLLYGFNHGGFVLITGEVGTGKTTLLRNLIKQTPPDVDVAFILNPRLTVRDLLETLCDELGIAYAQSGVQTVKHYIDLLNRHLLRTHQSGRSTVVIIDEAQNLSPAVLEQIRLLTNLETDERKLLRMILLGQPELGELLERPELRQLAQRITAGYHLAGLSREDTLAYVVHRLSRAGGNAHTFTRRALGRLYRISHGIPRIINTVADRALLGAYVEGKQRVSAGIVDRAADEVLGPQPRYRLWLAATVTSLAAAGMAWAYFSPDFGPVPDVPPDPVDIRPVAAEVTATEPGHPLVSAPSQTPDASSSRSARPKIAAVPARPSEPALASEPAVPSEPVYTPATPTTPATPATLASAPSSGNDSGVRIQRPPGGTYRTQRQAYAAVFDRWGANYANAPDDMIPCDFAPTAGLQCLSMRGSWTDISQLNLPVVLELWDGEQNPYYGAVTGFSEGSYQLRIGGSAVAASPRDLRDIWFGAYVVLWQTPPGYHGNLRQGSRHSSVAWLRQQLEGLTSVSLASPEAELFDARLSEAVIEFQRAQGLVTDGVVGPATWIRLADELNLPSPNLTG